MAVDAQQRLFRIVAGGWGIIYAIRADGVVQWWYHTGSQTGAATWANNYAPRDIGSGFHDFVEILGSDNGTLWGVRGNGDVLRFRYVVTNMSTGEGSWDNNGNGVQVGTGWNRFPRIFGGPGGILWGVDQAGDLYRSTYTNGSLTSPVKVGDGFQDCKWLAGDLDGVIYGIRLGHLYWWRYSSSGWSNGGNPIKIAVDGHDDWDDWAATYICAAATGLFYAAAPDENLAVSASDLLWSRLKNFQTVDSGGAQWENSGAAKTVGNGFTIEPWAPLQGYANPLSVPAGGTVAIAGSTTHSTLTASVLRHDVVGTPVVMQAPQTITGRLQTLPTGFASTGCGWTSLLNVTVQAAWPSGVYSARLEGPYGKYRHIPFVVRPAAPKAALAVILPTLTYEAYNTWSGHSAYNNCPSTAQVALSSRRPSRTMQVESQGRLDVELYSDLLLLRWLAGQGIPYDVYTDHDLHGDLGLPGRYRAVMLGSHPEYVTGAMRQALALYIKGGGHLIYTGGNGLYEPCELSADSTRTMWRVPDGNRHYYRQRDLPESQLLGVAYDENLDAWMTFKPYKVLVNHPILSGTGLTVGSTFGAGGFNHDASGWECDRSSALDGSATSSEIIAAGQNLTTNGGAHMVLIDRPGGGRIFSAGSMTFNGALAADTAMSTLFRNVVTSFTAP